MMKRLLATLVAIGMAMHLSGCTSSGSKDEADAATSPDASNFSDESKGDFADGTKSAEASSEAGAAAQPQAQADAAAGGDNLDLDAPADAPPADATADATANQAQTDAQPAPPVKDGDLSLDDADPDHEFPEAVAQAPPNADAPPAVAPAPVDAAQAANPPPTDEPLFNANTPPAEAPPAEAAAPETPAAPMETQEPKRTVVYAPLMKVKDQPFTQKGALLNRVYVARQGDSWKSVSEKVYGANKTKDLKRWNAGIGSRQLKVGDKVYYNSPKDPADNARMLVYYEEQGLPPQIYATKDGDNLRTVGKRLLGDKNSWKELWVTNPELASKGALPAGVGIRYWNDAGAGPTQAMASAQPPPPQQPPPADGMVPPASPNDAMDPTGTVAMNNPPAQQQPPAQAPPPPPPPAAAAVEPPPPPPPPPPAAAPMKKMAKAEPADASSGDQDMMFWLACSGVMLLAAAATFIVIRKNRAKRIDLSQTQV